MMMMTMMMMSVYCRLHGRRLNLTKVLAGPESEHLYWGTTPRPAKGRVGVGMDRDWIGFGVRLCLDSQEWGMKIVGYEKAEFSEICK